MISAIVDSNTVRKDHIAFSIINKHPKVVGIYRLIMKTSSDNFRASAILGIMKRIKGKGIEVVLFGPELKEDEFFHSKVYKDLSEFKATVISYGLSIYLAKSNASAGFYLLPTRAYSIYLWHWPIVVALVYAELLQNTVALIVGLFLAGLFLSLLLGHASFHLIENTTRKYLQKLSLIKGRIDPVIEKIFNGAIDRNPQSNCLAFGKDEKVPECQYGGKELGVIVLGDSLSASIMHTVEKALPSKDLHVLDWSKAGCPTIKNVKKIDKSGVGDQSCGLFINYAVERLKEIEPKVPVIIYSYSSSYFIGRFNSEVEAELQKPDAFIDNLYSFRNQYFFNDITIEFEKTICEISSTRDVYLLKPTPEFHENIPYYLGRKRMLSGTSPSVKMKREDYINRNNKLLNFYDKVTKNCNVHLLDPTEYLCNKKACLADDKGIPMYYDGHHLSEHGANKLLPMFKVIAQ
jgi:hypothetical protein